MVPYLANERDGFGCSFLFCFRMCSYSAVSQSVLGSQLADYYTFVDSFVSLMRILLGDFNYEDIATVAPRMGPVLFWSYVFVVFFVLLKFVATRMYYALLPCLFGLCTDDDVWWECVGMRVCSLWLDVRLFWSSCVSQFTGVLQRVSLHRWYASRCHNNVHTCTSVVYVHLDLLCGLRLHCNETVDAYIIVKEGASDSDSFLTSLIEVSKPSLVRWQYRVYVLTDYLHMYSRTHQVCGGHWGTLQWSCVESACVFTMLPAVCPSFPFLCAADLRCKIPACADVACGVATSVAFPSTRAPE